MTGQKKATIHNWKTGGYTIYAVAYRKDPYGPHGGTCGIITLPDGEYEIIHTPGSRQYEIVCLEDVRPGMSILITRVKSTTKNKNLYIG